MGVNNLKGRNGKMSDAYLTQGRVSNTSLNNNDAKSSSGVNALRKSKTKNKKKN